MLGGEWRRTVLAVLQKLLTHFYLLIFQELSNLKHEGKQFRTGSHQLSFNKHVRIFHDILQVKVLQTQLHLNFLISISILLRCIVFLCCSAFCVRFYAYVNKAKCRCQSRYNMQIISWWQRFVNRSSVISELLKVDWKWFSTGHDILQSYITSKTHCYWWMRVFKLMQDDDKLIKNHYGKVKSLLCTCNLKPHGLHDACSPALNPKRPLHLLQCYCHIAMVTTPAASDWLGAVATHHVCRYESYAVRAMAVLQALDLYTSL